VTAQLCHRAEEPPVDVLPADRGGALEQPRIEGPRHRATVQACHERAGVPSSRTGDAPTCSVSAVPAYGAVRHSAARRASSASRQYQ
jgi:hypothetical protein